VSDGGWRRTEDRGERTEDRGQRTDDGGVRSEETGDRRQERKRPSEIVWKEAWRNRAVLLHFAPAFLMVRLLLTVETVPIVFSLWTLLTQ
jgi:hypothetical protein